MTTSFDLLYENVRSFAGSHRLRIKPVTILVGENSTGKSTIMSLLSVVCGSAGFPFSPDFNRSPYSLGGFETIATFKGGKYGRAKAFRLGFSVDSPDQDRRLEVLATYAGHAGQPELSKLNIETKAARNNNLS